MERIYNVSATVENSLAVPQTVKDRINLWPSNTTARNLPQRTENGYSNENLCVSEHLPSSSISNPRWNQPKCPPTDERINKIWVCLYNGLLFSCKKRCGANTRYNVKLPKMLSRRSPQHENMISSYDISRTDTSLGTQGRLISGSQWLGRVGKGQWP